MHGKAMGRPLWLPFCWANTPNCSFPISHSLDGTLFVSLHFILTGEDCSQGQWANSPEKSQLSPAVPRRTSIFISAPSCQRIGEFMSGSWINCFKPWGRRRLFYHQMFSKMFPSKLFRTPPPPPPLPHPHPHTHTHTHTHTHKSSYRSLQTFGICYIQDEFLQHKWCVWLLWQHSGASCNGRQHGCRGFGGTNTNSKLLHACLLGSLSP